ncbi:membrane protein of ER body-like protein [Quillaja saponaria]|uniref:Membrane protein of ER body-like protein n=1 Tax=Quillaja saponaria TaxID=32244 RepID=A0AAD7KMI9_QUISA|nr:membrane protein of ER body-like protein [Quillaja saponaria]KAJ7961560.1 membrane protein of ER body-like protein [Quillaja saponaria]
MEVLVRPREEAGTEVEEGALRPRKPHQNDSNAINVTSCDSSKYQSQKKGPEYMHESSAVNHQMHKQLEIIVENSGFQKGHKNKDIHKNDETILPASVSPVYKDITPGLPRIEIRIENEQEVTDLYLENLCKKPPTHAFYCPNCKACIEKVVIVPAKPKQTEPIRCTKCLGFLIPIGKWLFPNWVVPIDEEPSSPTGESSIESGSATTIPTVLLPIAPSPENLGGTLTEPETKDPEVSTTTRSQTTDAGKMWEVLKSIVYGGLLEVIASLGVVTSAASADATTLNIVVLAFANLMSGLFVLVNNILEMKADQPRRSNNEEEAVVVDRYKQLLGERNNFILHAFFSILSFLIFGLVPPVVYGFSFFESDNKDIKLAAVAGASLLCITLLAIAKAHIKKATFKTYVTTVLYYVSTGAVASTVSYLAGVLIQKLIEKLVPNFAQPQIPQMSMSKFTLASY